MVRSGQGREVREGSEGREGREGRKPRALAHYLEKPRRQRMLQGVRNFEKWLRSPGEPGHSTVMVRSWYGHALRVGE